MKNPNYTKLFTAVIATLLIIETTKAQIDNEFLGLGAGWSILSGGNYNVMLGDSAGYSTTIGSRNVFIGKATGFNYVNDNDNIGIGFHSLRGNGLTIPTGNENIAIGSYTLTSITSGYDNIVIGDEAGRNNTTGNDNVFIGTRSGYNNIGGNDNTFVGEEAGYNNTEGDNNTFIGFQVGRSNTTGKGNTFVGSDAAGLGFLTEFQNGNLSDGAFSTGEFNTTGKGNTFLGASAGGQTEGNGNTFVGYSAGARNRQADYNTFIGFGAGSANNIANEANLANHNTYLGYLTGAKNRKGEHNVGIGSLADFGNFGGASTDVNRTIFIGASSFINNNDAIAIGYNTSVTGFKAIVLGNNATANSSYSVAIGADAVVTTANSMVLGGNTPTTRVSVGIGTSAPNNNASLDLGDDDKGLLLNRLTTALRTTLGASLTSAEAGLMVYDTDLNESQIWDGTQWDGSGGAPSIEYNTGFALNGISDSLVIQDAGTRFAVELLSLQDGTGTDSQTLSLTGTDITISGGNILDVSSLQDGTGTDDQTVDAFSLAGTTLSLSLEGDGVTNNTVDLSSLQDGIGTDSQDLSLTTNTLSLTNDASTVDLSGYLDNTDSQTLSLAGTDITISGGNTLDVSSLQDGTGTDDQTVDVFSLSGTTLSLSLESDGVVNNTVDLSSLAGSGGTDDQNISGSGLAGTNLTIAIENGSSEIIDLGPLLVGLQNTINALTLRVDSLEMAVNTCCGTSLKVDAVIGENGPLLGQNFPNPFNENTTIEYYLPNTVQTSYMDIVAVNGALIKTIQINSRGDGHIILGTGDMAPGNYFYSMYADGLLIGTKQMIVSK